jgi:hypothetical protein
VSGLVRLQAGDRVEIFVIHNGPDATIQPVASETTFSGTRVN